MPTTTRMCESFFATLECELLDRGRFATPETARGTTLAGDTPRSAICRPWRMKSGSYQRFAPKAVEPLRNRVESERACGGAIRPRVAAKRSSWGYDPAARVSARDRISAAISPASLASVRFMPRTMDW